MKVHLIDGTFELFRAYYGTPPRTGADGAELGAVAGLMRSLLSLLAQPDVSHVAVAFDHEIESFRNQLFDGYKTGEGLDPVLYSQFGPAEDAMRALGLVVWPMIEFEADDGLATGAARFASEPDVAQVVLCSPDKDLAQCVSGRHVVCFDRMRRRLLDDTGVWARFGVAPASMPDWLALVGDSADGIPGIPRWGAKSAATVLAHYDHIEAIPDDPDTWQIKVRGARALADNLAAMREEAALYRQLATLRIDVPLAESLADLRWRGPDGPSLATWCARLKDDSLQRRTDELAARR